jgi:hypothetical protein
VEILDLADKLWRGEVTGIFSWAAHESAAIR